MQSFSYYSPTKIVFGIDAFAGLGAEASAYGTKVLLVKAEGPLEKLGVYARAQHSLQEAGLSVWSLDGVVSNPRLTKIEEGIAFCRKNDIQMVVAVGGGSAIDTAKAVAFGAPDSGDVWDFFAGKRRVGAILPVLSASTISATGAEISCHCVVTNDRDPDRANWLKWGVHDPAVCPRVAVLDPRLLATVPPRLSAAGMCDAISHVLEGYFDGVPDNPMSDYIGEGVVKVILENEAVLSEPENLTARGNICWASSLAMSGLADCGRANQGWPAHWIQHAIGALTDTSHGEGLSILLPAWMRYVNARTPQKFVQFSKNVMGLARKAGASDEAYGLSGIDKLSGIFGRWGMPATLAELGVTRDMQPAILENIQNSPDQYAFAPGVVEDILASCW